MSDVLSGLGLQPAPEDEPTADAPAAPEPTSAAPEAPEQPAAPAAEPADDKIVAPEGAENPDAVVNAIKAERKKARDAYAKARDLEQQLQARVEAEMPLEQRVAEATKRAEEAERKSLRLEVGIASGLSQDLIDRLKGDTKEEMEADAQAFLTSLNAAKPTPPAGFSLNGGPQTPAPAAPADPGRAHAQLLGALIAGSRGQ